MIHSHNYSGWQQFTRNFDLGVSHVQYPAVFDGVPPEGEGMKLVKKTAVYLAKTAPWLLPKLIWQSGMKWLGYRFGKKCQKLPPGLVPSAVCRKATGSRRKMKTIKSRFRKLPRSGFFTNGHNYSVYCLQSKQTHRIRQRMRKEVTTWVTDTTRKKQPDRSIWTTQRRRAAGRNTRTVHRKRMRRICRRTVACPMTHQHMAETRVRRITRRTHPTTRRTHSTAHRTLTRARSPRAAVTNIKIIITTDTGAMIQNRNMAISQAYSERLRPKKRFCGQMDCC
ncbi:MAG: hypothetical protein ACLURV_00495 [Gallintestinimicrobium sp.]